MSSSIWSDLETIILKEISIESEEYTHHSVTKLYNDIVYYSTCCFCTHTLPENAILREKSLQQVSFKLRTFNHPSLPMINHHFVCVYLSILMHC